MLSYSIVLRCPPAESKAAKKNRKKRKATDKPSKDEGFEIVEEVTAPAKKRPSPPSDPIADIKRQIEEAKASKVSSFKMAIITGSEGYNK